MSGRALRVSKSEGFGKRYNETMDNAIIEREQIQRDRMIANWDEVKAAVLPEFEAMRRRFPTLVELHDIPSRTLSIRKPAFPAAIVRATMSLNGDSIVVERSRHESRDDIAGKGEKDIITIDVENNSTSYVFDGRRIGVAEIAAIILQPIRDSLSVVIHKSPRAVCFGNHKHEGSNVGT